MTTYLILSPIFFIIFIVFLVYIFSQITSLKAKGSNSNKSDLQTMDLYSRLDWKVYFLLILVLILVLTAFYSPYIFTRSAVNSDFNFSATGQIGDTIGGLMNPFIALAGVIVTGLAFYIQYKANLLQRELFAEEQKESNSQLQLQINNQNQQNRIQQFESQFYEMLKLHRENITEMVIEGYDFEETTKGLQKFEKDTSGRKVFVTMKMELECVLSLYIGMGNRLDEKAFKKCYNLFFSGLDAFRKKHPEEKDFVDLLQKLRLKHKNPDSKTIKTNTDRKAATKNVNLKFNYTPFSGHASRLGHYFRHLYLAVKSTVGSNNPMVEYEEKMRYLKLLRAQLSNHEQILLFYNWLGGHGNDWENDKHPFFTEYCMIHNLWYDALLDNEFIEQKVNYLRTKPTLLRKGKMFEID